VGTPVKTPSPASVFADPADVAAPSANAAAAVTYAAVPGFSHCVSGLMWSYSGAPTGGNIKVEDGSGNTVFSLDISSAGVGFLPFSPAKRGAANTAMIVTLAAGGGGVVGKLSIPAHWTD
jgi:hypothetical protein